MGVPHILLDEIGALSRPQLYENFLYLTDSSGVVSPLEFFAKFDGVTDDSGAVQKAIEKIRTIGYGVLLLPAGKTCYLNAQINLADNMIVWGYGSRIRVGRGFAGINNPLFKNFAGTSVNAPGARIASQNIGFYGIEFDGEDAGGAAGTTIPNANMHGFVIACGGWTANSGVDGFVLRDCYGHNFSGACVSLWKSSNIDVSNNRFVNFFVNTSLSVGSAVDMHECDRVTVHKNKFNHTAAGLSWHGAVFLDWDAGCSNFVVSDNEVTNMNGGDGLSCEGNGGAGSNMANGIFANNVIVNCAGQGLSLDGCKSVKAVSNFIRSVTGPGILGTGTPEFECISNTIETSGLGGIVTRSGTTYGRVLGNNIRSITFFDANFRGHGVEMVNTAARAIFAVQNNTINDTDASGTYLVVDNAFNSSFVIDGNDVTNCGRLATLGDTLRASIFAAGGIVSDNMLTSTGNTQYAISSGSGEFPSIDGNRLQGIFGLASFFIGYRSGVPLNQASSIIDAHYDASSNIFSGKFNGTPGATWFRGDTFDATLPVSAGYKGVVYTATGFKNYGLIT